MKKISLKLLMLVQTVVAFCIPLYYHLMVIYKLNSNIPPFISIIILLAVSYLKRNAEIMDEYAKKTLQIADSFCFKIAILIMGIVTLPFLLIDGISTFIIGYILTFGIFILILIRAIIFWWIDKKGME